MLPYGWDGTKFIHLLVDDEGRTISAIKGAADVQWGLRGWWKFIASEDTTIKDYSGYDNKGSALSGVASEAKYQDGVIGQAIELDGVDDYILNESASGLSTDVGTFECWIYHKGNIADEDTIIELSDGTMNNRILIAFQTSDILHVYIKPLGTMVAVVSGVTGINIWRHLVFTWDVVNDIYKIYLNAVDTEATQLPTTGAAGLDHIYIGADQNAVNCFHGYIDEMRVYGRVLSLEEIQWRYEHTNPATGKPTRMIAVDNEGRMMVNVQDLPYKTRILDHDDKFIAGGGGTNLYSSYVPNGKVWVLTSVLAYTDTADCDAIDIGIFDGTDNYIIEYVRGTGACQRVFNRGNLILKAGDRVNVGFVGLPLNAVIVLNVNGYELDAL